MTPPPGFCYTNHVFMITLKLFFGVFFFLLGGVYLYKPNLVGELNRIARDILFNDRRVLLERKKLAILFFCLSFMALYMGFSSLTAEKQENWLIGTNHYLMYMAMQDYCTARYQNAIEKYERILRSDPNNVRALKRLAFTYEACGEKRKAKALWVKLGTLLPESTEIRDKSGKTDHEKIANH